MARIAMLLSSAGRFDPRMERSAGTLAGAGHEVRAFLLPCEGVPRESTRGGYSIVREPPPPWASWTGLRRIYVLEHWFERATPLATAAGAWRPDIIHAIDLDTLLPGALEAERLSIPLVYEDRELCLEKIRQGTPEWLSGPKKWLLEWFNGRLESRGLRLEKEWIHRAAAFLSACPLYADALEERHGRRPVVLLNTPHRSDLPPDPRLRGDAGLPPDARVALYQGSITPSGGAQECIAAAREFPEGWFLVFLGVSWMRGHLEEVARSLGVLDKVRFLSPVPPDILPGYTRAADIGLAPLRPVNRGQSLSQANKIFEYFHAGLPIVASDVPGQAKLIRDHDAGILIPEVTPSAIAGAVKVLANRPEATRRAQGDQLRTVARERYCWEVESKKLVAEYGSVLEKRESPGAPPRHSS